MTYRKLAEKYQEFNPFKFIIYSGKSGDRIPQMAPEPLAAEAATAQRGGR